MNRLSYIVLLALVLGLAGEAAAQDVSVQASVSETTIGTEERVVYSIEIQGVAFSDILPPEPPATEGLALVQPYPSTQRNMTFINGQMQQSVAFRWTYRPIREGTARFGPAQVSIQDQTYQTDAVEVHVVPQAQRPQAQRSSRSGWPFGGQRQPARPDAREEQPRLQNEDLFIRAVPSTRRAHQNEQVTIEYQLFFRDGVQLRHSRLAGSWDAEGFWREEFEVESRPIPRTVVENGLRYNTITLKRVAVFPTHAGTLQVDPLRIETEAYVPTRSADPFDQFFSLRDRFETVELASPAVEITALPLPSEAPAAFSGAVGTYRMEAQMDRRAVEVGEPVELTVRITGAGNLATLDLPAYDPPGVFEQYDPQVDVQIHREGQRIQGTKTFTYVLVPRSNGTFALPPVTFTYFDPTTDRYETLQSDPLPIRVTGSAAAPPAASATAAGLPVDDIAGLMAGTVAWEPAHPTPLYRQLWVYLALVVPVLLTGGVYLYRRHATRLATDTEYARHRMAHPVARKHLKQADVLFRQDQPRAFYEELARAVLSFVGNRLNLPEQRLTRPQLDARLAEAGVPEPTRRALRELLDACDRARFAPIRPDRAEMERARDLAARLIVEVDEAHAQAPTLSAG